VKVHAATATTLDGGFDLLVREATDQPWKTMRRWGPDDYGGAVSFSADGKTFYIRGSHNANPAYLTTSVGVPAKNLPTVLLVHGGPWGCGA
jgi:hypothetical protein